MDRLKDQKGERDPLHAKAARLVESFPPHAPSEAQAARVRARLASGQRRPRAGFVLRPAVAAVLVLGFAAAASAMVGRWYVHRNAPRVVPTTVVTPVPPLPPLPPLAPLPPVAPLAPLPPVPPQPPLAPLPPVPPAAPLPRVPPARAVPPAPAIAPAHRPAPLLAPVELPPVPPPSAPADVDPSRDPSRESAIVLAAQRALRVEHAPERAAVLLDDYLRRYPDGALAEEALGLAIEAAASSDDAKAAQLGQRYLGQFPRGRFAAAARAAIRRAQTGD